MVKFKKNKDGVEFEMSEELFREYVKPKGFYKLLRPNKANKESKVKSRLVKLWRALVRLLLFVPKIIAIFQLIE